MFSTLFNPLTQDTYQVRKRVEFLAHQRRLLPPPGYLAVHEVEEQSKGHEREGGPQVTEFARVSEAVAQRGEDGHDAAEACHHELAPRYSRCKNEEYTIELRDQVCEVKRPVSVSREPCDVDRLFHT